MSRASNNAISISTKLDKLAGIICIFQILGKSFGFDPLQIEQSLRILNQGDIALGFEIFQTIQIPKELFII